MADNEKKSGEKKTGGIRQLGKKSVKFFRDCALEVKKVVWPKPKSVFKNTGVVLATIVIIGLFIFGLDTLFMNLLGLIMSIPT